MNAKEKLIMFMKKKQEKIGAEFDYFNEKDAEAIRLWEEEKCKNIWKYITESIGIYEARGLIEYVCPFCIYHDLCINCEYAKNRNNIFCTTNGSELAKITKHLRISGKENIFSNEAYKQILQETGETNDS